MEFIVEDIFEIKGVGTVHMGRSPVTLREGETLVGRSVNVDGVDRTIRMVDAYAKRSPIQAGEAIGLVFDGPGGNAPPP